MKKTFLAALAAPAAALMALAFSPAASAQPYPYRAPNYSGDAEGQAAYQKSIERQRYGPYGPPWQTYGGAPRVPQWQSHLPAWQRHLPGWQRRGLEAAPRGYRWQRYGDRFALVRRSDGAVVQWR